MGVGWSLSQDVIPESTAARAGAVTSTIPVFAFIAYVYLILKFGAISSVLVKWEYHCLGLCCCCCCFVAENGGCDD